MSKDLWQPGDIVVMPPSRVPTPRMYSEREVIHRERAAFAMAVRRYAALPGSWVDTAAADAYPLPKVTRPRIVTDQFGGRWRWTSDYGLQTSELRSGVDRWEQCRLPIGEPLRLVIAELLTNPTEEVEAE